MVLVVGVAFGILSSMPCSPLADVNPAAARKHRTVRYAVGALALGVLGIVSVLCCFLSPPPFSQPVAYAAPAHAMNPPQSSIYLGNGCFWHTQYDFVLLEQAADGPFGGRADTAVTSLVGYAGGNYASLGPRPTACYHGIPMLDYGKLGHGEAVSVALDPTRLQQQVAALAHTYFHEGFVSVPCEAGSLGCVDGTRRQRLDPQDAGQMYRNVIGLPGGMDNRTLYPMIQQANAHKMPLVRGAGGPASDGEGEYVVYVYDSRTHPFFRGEGHHQFHTNDVIGRSVPRSYTETLKQAQDAAGRLSGHGCIDPPPRYLGLLVNLVLAIPLGAAIGLARHLAPELRLRLLRRRRGDGRRGGAGADHGRDAPGVRAAASSSSDGETW